MCKGPYWICFRTAKAYHVEYRSKLAMDKFQYIDGSLMEGGGQVLRIATSLSCLLGRPVRIGKIRGGRSPPGLKAQHLAGLRLVAEMCGGQLTGDSPGSCEITFCPGTVRGGDFKAETGTAGSVGLLLQVSLPCALLAATTPSRLTLRGGTNAAFAPQIDYTQQVFSPLLERFGGNMRCDLVRRGYFPRGGGHLDVSISPVAGLRSVDLTEPGPLLSVTGSAFVAGKLPLNVAEAAAAAARRLLISALPPNTPVDVTAWRDESQAAGTPGAACVLLTAATGAGCRLGGSALGGGRGRVDGRRLGEQAAEEVLRSVRAAACVDQYCQDQCVLLMALADGRSRIRTVLPTLHTQTAIQLTEQLTQAKFTVEKCEADDSCTIECVGVGYQRNRAG